MFDYIIFLDFMFLLLGSKTRYRRPKIKYKKNKNHSEILFRNPLQALKNMFTVLLYLFLKRLIRSFS